MKNNRKGLTLIELIVVVAILGILSSIAISLVFRLSERAYIKTLESDLSAAYKTAVLYHTENPDGAVTLDILNQNGYRESDNVKLEVVNGFRDTLLIKAVHPSVTGIYQVDDTGRIAKQ